MIDLRVRFGRMPRYIEEEVIQFVDSLKRRRKGGRGSL